MYVPYTFITRCARVIHPLFVSYVHTESNEFSARSDKTRSKSLGLKTTALHPQHWQVDAAVPSPPLPPYIPAQRQTAAVLGHPWDPSTIRWVIAMHWYNTSLSSLCRSLQVPHTTTRVFDQSGSIAATLHVLPRDRIWTPFGKIPIVR